MWLWKIGFRIQILGFFDVGTCNFENPNKIRLPKYDATEPESQYKVQGESSGPSLVIADPALAGRESLRLAGGQTLPG